MLLLADAGYAGYGNIVTTSTKLVTEKPDVVQRFIDASIEGWYSYLYGDPAPANRLIKQDNPEMTDALLAYGREVMKTHGIVNSGDALKLGIGAMTDARWAEFYRSMADVGVYPKGLDVTKAYTLRFVDKRVGMDMLSCHVVMLQVLASVGRRFGAVEALRDVSLTIGAGDFVALLGPSGCGKSTLLRLIAGMDQPDTGRMIWDAGHQPKPGEIGFVFQDATLLPWASAADNVFLPLRIARHLARPGMPQVNHAALHRVGLDGFEAARPRQLSGGMRMRVSIARALVTRPRLLLMDEPFAALDEFTRHKLQEDLLSLWQELGCTVVFVTHSIYEAAFLARRIVLMTPRPGRIDHEIASPLHPGAAARLIRPMPRWWRR